MFLSDGLYWNQPYYFRHVIVTESAKVFSEETRLILSNMGDTDSRDAARIAYTLACNQWGPASVHINEDSISRSKGSSAGITYFLALASLLTDKPPLMAMAATGTINLQGEVGTIGGLSEKGYAAYKAGVKHILIPKGNEKEIKNLPLFIQKAVEIVPVKNIEQALLSAGF